MSGDMPESVQRTLIQALACLPWQYRQFVFDNDVDGVKTRWEDAWSWVEANGPHTEEMGK